MLKKIELLIGILAFVIALVLFYRQPDLNNTQLVFVALGALVTIYSQRDRIRDFITPPEPTPIIETTCGDRPLNLADQRLHISLIFGAYFTSLLEKEALYTPIPEQLVCAQAAQGHRRRHRIWRGRPGRSAVPRACEHPENQHESASGQGKASGRKAALIGGCWGACNAALR